MSKFFKLLVLWASVLTVTAVAETITATKTVANICGMDLSNYAVPLGLDGTSDQVAYNILSNTGTANVITVDSIVPTGNDAGGTPLTGSSFYVTLDSEQLAATEDSTGLGTGNVTGGIGISTDLTEVQLEAGLITVVATITLSCP